MAKKNYQVCRDGVNTGVEYSTLHSAKKYCHEMAVEYDEYDWSVWSIKDTNYVYREENRGLALAIESANRCYVYVTGNADKMIVQISKTQAMDLLAQNHLCDFSYQLEEIYDKGEWVLGCVIGAIEEFELKDQD